jgi:hypothetical protein
MRSKQVLLLAALFLPWFISNPAAKRTGGISGTVVTDNGYPVANAHVRAEVMDGENIVTALEEQTDEHGKFLFSQLTFGEYRISADKREAGYLSTAPDIFTCKPPLTIVVSEKSPRADTSVRFMPKRATISGWVKDTKTSESIFAHLSLAAISGCGWLTAGTAGKDGFELLVPSNTPITFGACSEGYKAWTPLSLNLRPGSTFEIEVLLERDEENEETLCSAGTY